ncbi:Sugar fermentation stimulation protein A [Sinobacterium norvegicum]|uniref:Sugar fermentation stimulation protein homolog n=1 Tax=Sinobacterium norvegicum TaxID=1641715 RepID=A0ABM9AGB8_9GAMM|nr:DNA/RNA nuclease SfsA [Sinobacterium norvegicum]CAH0992257.1 Sugar fermentation stimulation protein A [Sinobacterium norvegicum]
MRLPELVEGRLIKRYKRFLADVELLNGEIITAHCPNTGKMTGCAMPGERVWLSISDNPKRKYKHGWVLAEIDHQQVLDNSPARLSLACIHSAFANDLLAEALAEGVVEELAGYSQVVREARYGLENSRIDFLLSAPQRRKCYVEVKSVTLLRENGIGQFPDAVSDRGRKHLRELMAMVAEGYRAVLFYCVQHEGIEVVEPARDIDPSYCQTLLEAMAAGVEVIAYRASITPKAITIDRRLHFNS